MAKLISKTYGEALYELAVEEGKEDVLLSEIQSLKEILSENPDFSKLMNHPRILKEEKEEVLDRVFKDKVSDELVGFLHLIIQKDRYSDLDAILDYFIDEIKKKKGIGVAYVTTAIVLSDEKRKEVEEKLLETTSFHQMEMHYQVDDTLIGGMVIRIGDRVVDSSIATKLNEIKRQLLKTEIKQ